MIPIYEILEREFKFPAQQSSRSCAARCSPAAPCRIRLTNEIRTRFEPAVPDGFVPIAKAAKRLGVARQTVLHQIPRGQRSRSHPGPPNRPSHRSSRRRRWTLWSSSRRRWRAARNLARGASGRGRDGASREGRRRGCARGGWRRRARPRRRRRWRSSRRGRRTPPGHPAESPASSPDAPTGRCLALVRFWCRAQRWGILSSETASSTSSANASGSRVRTYVDTAS